LRKNLNRGMIGLLLLIVTLVIYTIWDNNRITVAKQDIIIDHLPKEFEGYKILQVTDLHEKEFGKDEKRLIQAINSIHYDAIVFTGDMLVNRQSKNYKPFYKLLEGIKNKENAFYVPGNEDPDVYHINSKGVLDKNEFVKGIEKRGVKLLESIYSIKRGKANIHFVDFEMSILEPSQQIQQINGIVTPNYAKSKQYVDYRNQLLKKMSILDHLTNSDVLIALNHFPVVDARIDNIMNNPNLKFRNYDLIIAGHYHGGQIRIPFLGALFVPEAWNDSTGFFPPQNRVKGLWEYKQTKQYVSTGLGSSAAIPFLKFRLFNPPEINVLTLKREK